MKRFIFYSAFLILFSQNILFAQWIQTNGPGGGEVKAIVKDSLRIYAGLFNGGVHISYNNGLTWQRSNAGFQYPFQIQAMVIKDNYVFTGVMSGGVYLSSDYGQSWNKANNGLPSSSINVLAEAGSFVFVGFHNGLYRSSNYGSNWNYSGTGLTNNNVKAIKLKDTTMFVGTADGIFSSTNYGEVWIEKSNGLMNRDINDFLIVDDTIYVATMDGVYKSTDEGENWIQDGTGLPSSYIHSLAFNDNILFAGTFWYGIYVSHDFGQNWIPFNNGYPESTIEPVLAEKGNQLFVGNSLGIFSLNKGDSTWVDLNSQLYGSEVKCFATKDSILAAGTFEGGVFITSDFGNNWISRRIVNGYNGTNHLKFQGDSLYALCFSGGLFVSPDLGLNWYSIYIPTQYFTALAIKGNIIAVGTDQTGVWISTNGGINWTQRISGLTSPYITSLAFDENNLYAGTFEGLFFSSDLGENWSKATSGIPSTLFVNTIKTIGEYIYVGGFPGLFLSSNGGSSWAYKGFNTREITAIEGYDDIVFVGASDFFTGSVFVSTNRGNTWSDYGDGLPNNTLFKLAIVDTVLFSGLYGYGAWNTSAIVTEVQNSYYPLPTDFLLYQNYPNPFNPSTKIRYSVPQTSNVIMKVFDVLGNEIETLIDEEKNTGTYEITWFADNLPSGIYFYRLQADSFVESKKMVLLK
jgi:photosystem II stability/assembly factor-like uncharacterized protein